MTGPTGPPGPTLRFYRRSGVITIRDGFASAIQRLGCDPQDFVLAPSRYSSETGQFLNVGYVRDGDRFMDFTVFAPVHKWRYPDY